MVNIQLVITFYTGCSWPFCLITGWWCYSTSRKLDCDCSHGYRYLF